MMVIHHNSISIITTIKMTIYILSVNSLDSIVFAALMKTLTLYGVLCVNTINTIYRFLAKPNLNQLIQMEISPPPRIDRELP